MILVQKVILVGLEIGSQEARGIKIDFHYRREESGNPIRQMIPNLRARILSDRVVLYDESQKKIEVGLGIKLLTPKLVVMVEDRIWKVILAARVD